MLTLSDVKNIRPGLAHGCKQQFLSFLDPFYSREQRAKKINKPKINKPQKSIPTTEFD